MIRRKSTVDHAERMRRTKIVEVFGVLDLCLQLTSDDRLLIRNMIKNGDDNLIQRIHQCKKDKNYHSLQIYLRKCVQKKKQSQKYAPICKGTSRGKTPNTNKTNNYQTQGSYQNSLQSSPSNKKGLKTSMTKLQIEKHIQNEINNEILKGIQRQQCQIQSRDITPRQIYRQIKPGNQTNRSITEVSQNESCLNLKDILKAKLNEKQRRTNNSWRQNKQNDQQLFSNIHPSLMLFPKKVESKSHSKQKRQQLKYGQFYKRIRKVIQQAY